MSEKIDSGSTLHSSLAAFTRRDFVKGAASAAMLGSATKLPAQRQRAVLSDGVKEHTFLAGSCARQNERQELRMRSYSVAIADGDPPQMRLRQNGCPVSRIPLTAELATENDRERLHDIRYSLKRESAERYTLEAIAESSLWENRRFVWRLLDDHIEFQQFATGHGKVGKCYFLSHGLSGLWDKGSSPGIEWNALFDADRYYSPAPNHASQTEFAIAIPQSLGFHAGAGGSSKEDFHPESVQGVFSPPPLFLSFHSDGGWMGLGIGARPGDYLFPGFEYWGSRYAGASFFVDYLGYQSVNGEFASPVLSLHFGWSALESLASYTKWMRRSGFGTEPASRDVAWHRLPIFCGWGEQKAEAATQGKEPNTFSTQAHYQHWIAELEQRALPAGTIVIDDKWQKAYGTFAVDEDKWPDMREFVAKQHSAGRRVLLWIPVASTEGLPRSLCVRHENGRLFADVGKPEYETMLRHRIRHLMRNVGVDGFKVDWVQAPVIPGVPFTGRTAGLEYVRRFQEIIYSEAHKWKSDAMVETQTPNVLFLNSSDVIRLNDVWCASRNVAQMMRGRAQIAHISGWKLVDTDNAGMTTLREWWGYMRQQPEIGIPALYFLSRTGTTFEEPTEEQRRELKSIWRRYICSVRNDVERFGREHVHSARE